MNNNNKHIRNYISVTGKISNLEFLYEEDNKKYYKTFIEVKRNDFQSNILPVIICEDLLCDIDINKNIKICGFVYSKTKFSTKKLKPNIYIFAEKIKNKDKVIIKRANTVKLDGSISKETFIKTTKSGTIIGHNVLKVHRYNNTNDYINIIAYNENALYLKNLHLGDEISIIGRFIYIGGKIDLYNIFIVMIEK
ncbi:single-strand binding family protein [Clostridioides difficile CD160]|nr:single-strand binding family protein [Clostridioides difficile CD160]